MRAIEQAVEQMAKHSTRRFHTISTQSAAAVAVALAVVHSGMKWYEIYVIIS